MGIKFCPKCKSENVALDGSLIVANPGAMFCKDCGFREINFPEKEKIKKQGKIKW